MRLEITELFYSQYYKLHQFMPFHAHVLIVKSVHFRGLAKGFHHGENLFKKALCAP